MMDRDDKRYLLEQLDMAERLRTGQSETSRHDAVEPNLGWAFDELLVVVRRLVEAIEETSDDR